MKARAPVLMKILPASSRSPFTRTVWESSKRACPSYTVHSDMFLSQAVTPSLDCRTMASLRALTRFMSTSTGPSITTPKSLLRRAMYAARALATSALVGMHPTFTQVPPNSLRSMTAVFRPSRVSLAAIDGPDWPVPITIASYACAMTHPIGPRIAVHLNRTSPPLNQILRSCREPVRAPQAVDPRWPAHDMSHAPDGPSRAPPYTLPSAAAEAQHRDEGINAVRHTYRRFPRRLPPGRSSHAPGESAASSAASVLSTVTVRSSCTRHGWLPSTTFRATTFAWT